MCASPMNICGTVRRPVVATRVGGLPEAVFSEVLGRLVEPHDPGALAEGLALELAAAAKKTPEEIRRVAVVPSCR